MMNRLRSVSVFVFIVVIVVLCALPQHYCITTQPHPRDVTDDIISSDDRYRVELLESMLGSYLCKILVSM